MKFYGQWKQDKYLYETFFKDKLNGFFVDVGAGDGILFSNTYFFEKNLNWNGIVIEPQKGFFKKLKKNRPNSRCYNYAINLKESQETMLGYSHTAGLKKSLAPEYLEHWAAVWEDDCPWLGKPFKKNLNKQIVKTIPLRNILKEINYIDLLKIDVEGGELGVLRSMDWFIPVKVICIEVTGEAIYPIGHKTSEQESETTDFIKNKGFVFNKRLGLDEIWINSAL